MYGKRGEEDTLDGKKMDLEIENVTWERRGQR